MITLETAIRESIRAGLLTEWARFTNSHLGQPRSAIEAAIDQMTGRDQAEWDKYFRFVIDYIWLPTQFGIWPKLPSLEGKE